jgi:hypothetical protein
MRKQLQREILDYCRGTLVEHNTKQSTAKINRFNEAFIETNKLVTTIIMTMSLLN